jgi:hypothetical protein
VDKGVHKPLLTAGIACNDGRFYKLPNPQAEFFSNKINDLQNAKSRRVAAFARLEKKFYVHKCEVRHRCCATLRIL